MEPEKISGYDPFADFDEMSECFSDVLDTHIYFLYKYHSWIGPNNHLQSMLGVAVSREEFEINVSRASDQRCFTKLTQKERDELSNIRDVFIGRALETVKAGSALPVVLLIYAFTFDAFELFAVMTLLCCEINSKYEKLFAYLQDDISRKRPTAETIIKLFGEPDDMISDYFGYFSEDSVLMRYIFTADGTGLGSAVLRLSPRIFTFLTEHGKLESGYELWRYTTELHPMYTDIDVADNIRKTVALSVEGKTSLVFISGKRGSGRRFQVKNCAKSFEEDVLFVNVREMCLENMESEFNSVVCMRAIKGCALCLTGFEYLLSEDREDSLIEFSSMLRRSQKYLGQRLYITSEEEWLDARLDENIIKINAVVPDTDEGSRITLWKEFMSGKPFSEDIDPREMAAKFRFTAGQIHAAAERAADLSRLSGESIISSDLLHECCYAQVVVKLNSLASPVKADYDWDDLVLPEKETELLKEACAQVKYRHTVYKEWGFGKKAAYGRGLSVLFSGPPGTGKTMAAQVITNCLHMRMYKVQISQVVSKYIGETEKNLRRIFTEAREANCILFFDEMDALFGKRSEVKDSHDRNANIETAYLLQQLEEYDGVILMATNLLQNIDEAFMRRISFVVAFPFPDIPTRKRLWTKLLDADAPLSDDIDYDFLAENFKIAGGNIKNCVIRAAFLAAEEGSPISMRHLIKSVVNEQQKNNVVVMREDLKEYADMVFGER